MTYTLMKRTEDATKSNLPTLHFVSDLDGRSLIITGDDLFRREAEEGRKAAPSMEQPKKYRIVIEEIEEIQ